MSKFYMFGIEGGDFSASFVMGETGFLFVVTTGSFFVVVLLLPHPIKKSVMVSPKSMLRISYPLLLML